MPELTTEIGEGGEFAHRPLPAARALISQIVRVAVARTRVRALGEDFPGRARVRSDRSRRRGRGGRDGRYGVRPARRRPPRGGSDRPWEAASRARRAVQRRCWRCSRRSSARPARARRRRYTSGRRVRVRPAPRARTRGRWRGGDLHGSGFNDAMACQFGPRVVPARAVSPRATACSASPRRSRDPGRVHSRRHHPHRRRGSLACHAPRGARN